MFISIFWSYIEDAGWLDGCKHNWKWGKVSKGGGIQEKKCNKCGKISREVIL